MKPATSLHFNIIALLLLTLAGNHVMADRSSPSQIAQKHLIVDTHIDVPYRVLDSGEDVSQATEKGDFDYPRAKSGGLNAAFMSIYIPAEKEPAGEAYEHANKLIDLVEGISQSAPDKFAIAHNTGDVYQQFDKGLISFPLGMENGAAIDGKLENLAHFQKRGIRYITLTHSKANHICDSSYDKNRPWGGLSPFGKELVPEMNRLGVMVDVSHVSDKAFRDVLEISKAPVIASHSSMRHFTPGFERNMSDEMLKAMAEKGGVIQINYGSAFLTAEANAYNAERGKAYKDWLEENKLEAGHDIRLQFYAEYAKDKPYPYASLEDVLDHIDHAVKVAGIKHVGIGSDYDGVGDSLPTGLKDVSSFPNLIAGLQKRGYSEEDIALILGGNLMRVWKQVEQIAEG